MLTQSNDRRASGMWWWYGTDKKEGGDKQLKRKRGEKAGWVDRGKYAALSNSAPDGAEHDAAVISFIHSADVSLLPDAYSHVFYSVRHESKHS